MGVFLNDDDGRHYLVRTIFNRELGREPASAQEHQQWAEAVRTQGADLTLAQIRDSPEAQKFRTKRGW